jgi:hypothetical protein
VLEPDLEATGARNRESEAVGVAKIQLEDVAATSEAAGEPPHSITGAWPI